ncbi:MAG TPA: FecR domain-containing protein [Thermoanaerobaculaceae bacterium]|nr:FecR domain-containing protein [Thermoanaerobaculaceae bacterium]HPS77157.1 FecR domain-containing protein [Thermoanaerobaculaceae bacterium]
MAFVSSSPSPNPRRLELDWVMVSIDSIRRWGLLALFVVLTVVLGGGAFLILHEPVEKRAQRAIRQATALEEEVRRGDVTTGLHEELDQASRLLVEARSDIERGDFAAGLARAEDSIRRFKLLAGLVGRDFVGTGQIIVTQGRVEIQRANQSQWERGREKQALYNGDFVKTGSDSSAEIIFSDGTIYRVGPDALMEMHREARGGAQPSSGEVKVKVGQVNVFTATNPSTVLTDSARAEVDRESRVGVEVAEDSSAVVAAYAGRASVTGVGGSRIDLDARQAVSAAANGSLSQRRPVPDPPLLELPAPSFLVNLDTTDRVTLQWRPVVACVAYELQVSRSRAFAQGVELTRKLNSNQAVLKIHRTGTYYWRVSGLGNDHLRSEWSSPRTFKAFTGTRITELSDTAPPALTVQRPTQMGNFFIIQGMTEPGCTVTVNGEAVEVDGVGSFKKTVALTREGWNFITIRSVDPTGNATEHRESVLVESD